MLMEFRDRNQGIGGSGLPILPLPGVPELLNEVADPNDVG